MSIFIEVLLATSKLFGILLFMYACKRLRKSKKEIHFRRFAMSRQQRITRAIFKIANKLYRRAFRKADFKDQAYAIREYTSALEALLAVTIVTNPTKQGILKDILAALATVRDLEKEMEVDYHE